MRKEERLEVFMLPWGQSEQDCAGFLLRRSAF